MNKTAIRVLAAVALALSLGACATREYVDQSAAQTNSRFQTVDTQVQAANQRADVATQEARAANQRVMEMESRLRALEARPTRMPRG